MELVVQIFFVVESISLIFYSKVRVHFFKTFTCINTFKGQQSKRYKDLFDFDSSRKQFSATFTENP